MTRNVLTASIWLSLAMGVSAAELSEAQLLAGADARIEKHRKADAVVNVVDAADKPIPGARVSVEQTKHQFLFGSNIYAFGNMAKDGDEKGEAAYRKRFAELFNYATLPFYWWSYERQKGKPNYKRTEEIADWCRRQGIETKGHPLAWNYAEPAWLPDDHEKIHKLQMRRIEDCVSMYRTGLITRWDVVNEAVHFERAECKRRAPKLTAAWEKTGRVEFTKQCFHHARKANVGATLLINDYRTDELYARLIEKLVDAEGKRLYDVIGIQSHMHGGTWSNRKIYDVCERYAKFGVPLHFTETTILSGRNGWELAKKGNAWPSTKEGEANQAREVERFYTMVFSHGAVEAITWWDFSDRHAWQRAPAGSLRKDMTPKPAYDRLMKLIKGKWWTKTEVVTDAKGEARFRGILGEYKITVTIDGKKPVVQKMTLTKGDANALTVTAP